MRASKALMRRFVAEVVHQGNTRLLATLIADDHAGHYLDGEHYGPEGVRNDVADFRTGFLDLAIVVETLIAEGDWVARRFVLRGTHAGLFLGIPATGRAVVVGGLALDRIADDK